MAEEDEVGAAVEAGAEDGEQEEEYVPVLEQKLRLRIAWQCERELAEQKKAEEGEGEGEGEKEEGEDDTKDSNETETAAAAQVSDVTLKYSLPVTMGASEHQVQISFENEEDKLSKVEEQTLELTSDEEFIRTFVSKGHASKVSVSYKVGEESHSIEAQVDLSSLLVGDKSKKASIKGSNLGKGVASVKKMMMHIYLEKEEVVMSGEEENGEDNTNTETAYIACPLLTKDLVDRLNPFVLKVKTIESLPDRPATMAQLDTQCEPVSLKYDFFDTRPLDETRSTGMAEETSTELWYKGLKSGKWISNEVDTMNYRDVEVNGVRVYFLGDRDEDEMFKHFFYDKIPIEVHDRLPILEDISAVQIQKESTSDEGGEESAKSNEPAKESSSSAPTTSYVCGLAHISLREFCIGYTSYESSVNVFPYTSIRGGADLDWKTRPGRYVESGTQVTYVARVAKSLKETGKQRYFQRAVFLLDYNDNQLLRAIKDIVTAANMQALHLKGSRALILQTLATYKFDKEQAKSTTLDILTGFQIIDGKMRLIVVEGLKHGAMTSIRDLVESTTSSPSYKTQHKAGQEEGSGSAAKFSKHLLFNPALCYSKRLYTSLGAQIHPIKLSAPLPQIMANCHTHSGRKVREECRAGLKRLSSLVTITWLRQADRMQLLPTSEMLNYIDKKFGGELTKLDEEGTDYDDAQGVVADMHELSLTNFNLSPGAKGLADTAASTLEKSTGSRTEEMKATRYSYSKPKVDFDNKAFEEEREKREEARSKRNFLEEYIKQLPEMEKMAQDIRDEWFTWNPQRLRRLRSPLQAIRTVKALGGGSPTQKLFKTLDSNAEKKKSQPEFIFPAPKSPGQYNSHPKRPTKARIEELEQPWIENEMYATLMRYDDESDDIVPFKTIMPAPAILEKNPDFFTSVHLCGEGLIKEQEEAKRNEIEKWNSKVVVDDPHFYSIIKSRKQVSQTDRHEITLKGQPIKKGFQISHVDPLPTSMHINCPYEEGDDTYLKRKVDPSKFTAGRDFVRHIRTDSSNVYKPKPKK